MLTPLIAEMAWRRRPKRLALIAGHWVVGARAWGAVARKEDHSMAKSHSADEPRTIEAVDRTKPRPRPKATRKFMKPTAPKQRAHNRGAARPRGRVEPGAAKTKQQAYLDLLSRSEGATVDDLQAATGWQQHSVRGFLAGAVKKKLGLTLLSEKPDAGPRRYRTAGLD